MFSFCVIICAISVELKIRDGIYRLDIHYNKINAWQINKSYLPEVLIIDQSLSCTCHTLCTRGLKIMWHEQTAGSDSHWTVVNMVSFYPRFYT
jgi:hypothetical protein